MRDNNKWDERRFRQQDEVQLRKPN
jgi:hypothetical protein